MPVLTTLKVPSLLIKRPPCASGLTPNPVSALGLKTGLTFLVVAINKIYAEETSCCFLDEFNFCSSTNMPTAAATHTDESVHHKVLKPACAAIRLPDSGPTI